jgi:ligand-binding sensor domain-containing protein/two-component sensor histidine kinase
LYCGVYNQNCPERGGLYALQAHSAPTHLLAGNVSAMMIDRSGRVWAGIGTARQGIGAAQQKESNAVTGAQYNHLTTSTTGLWMLTPSPVRVQTEADGLASRRVFALHQDQTGVIYAGTDKGLHRFDAAAGRWSLVGARPLGRPQPVIHALLEHPTKSNALLLGCESGVMEYTPATDRIEPCAPLQQMLQHKAAGVYRMTYSTIHKELWLSQGFNGVDCFALQPTSSVASQASSQASQQAGSQSSSQASSSQSWRLVRSFGVGDDDESLPSNVVRCLLADDGNSTDNGNGAGVWIGTLSGLVRWEYSTRRLHQYHHDPAQPHSIADNNTIHIITATDGAPRNANDNHDNRTKDIVIAGRGLNIYRPATDDFYTLKERGGVSLDRVCRVQSDERGGFWMVTDKGELLYHNRRTGITKAIACGEQENAAFHLGGTLRSNDGTLWFSAPQGIITFHPDALQAARDARSLVVSAVLRHDTLVAHTMRFASAFADISADTLRVDYGESFGIEVSSPQMTNAAEALYSFHLDGFDAAWSEPSTTRSIRFTNLWPREYTLRAAVIDEYGERSLMPAPLLVVVRPPWWLRWEFGLGVAMLMGAAAWTALRLRLRREQMRRRIAELRLQTLRLQMNPHFLFNSLAAVQDMIDDDPEEAQDYVAAIAKMIRLVLDSSESEVISLDKELAFLSTYLSLEQLRFGTFTYSIRAGEQVHSSSFQPSHFAAWRADRLEQPMEQVYVPVMMVQPLLENAIHHGVRPLGGGGEIHVSLRFVQHPSGQHSCEWVVEDNGIGRVEAASGKRAKEAAWRHLSRSTRVNGERIAAFATLYQAAYQPPLYEDLYDNDGAPCGTRVTLNVPVWDAETVKRVTNAATSVTAATAPTVTTTKQIPSDLPLTAPSTLLPSRLP